MPLLLVLLLGIVAGFINTNAGGASLLTIPALIFLGLPPAVANGTNRIAILIGALSATTTFKKKGVFDWQFGLQLALPALMGAIIGTCLVLSIPDDVFNITLSCVILLVLAIIVINPRGKIKKMIHDITKRERICAIAAFFFIGIYGGFIQAGVGFIIIATLSLITGLSLVTINALKVFVILIYTALSLTIFLLHGKVDLLLGVTLAIGQAIGAYLGSTFAVAKGDRWIRAILIISALAMAIKLSGLLDIVFGT